MTFRHILVPLNGSDRDAVALKTAFVLAPQFGAHVSALLVRPDTRAVMPIIGITLFPDVIADIANSAKQAADRAAGIARNTFSAVAARAGMTVVERPERRDTATTSFEEVEGFFFDCVSRAARFADLVVFGSLGEPTDYQLSAGFSDVLMAVGRPVLVSPKPLVRLPEKVVIGWDGRYAAARAVCMALPLLAQAKEVVAITARHPRRDLPNLEGLQGYLALSGIRVTESIVERGERSTGEALFDAAGKAGAELVVMGGYSRSPLREALLGGTTAYAVEELSLPVFLMH